MAYLRLLVIGLTVLGLVIDALKIRRPLSFPRLETWRKLEEAADMTDLFVGRSVDGGKRTTAALSSKRALVNENGRVGVIRCAR